MYAAFLAVVTERGRYSMLHASAGIMRSPPCSHAEIRYNAQLPQHEGFLSQPMGSAVPPQDVFSSKEW